MVLDVNVRKGLTFTFAMSGLFRRPVSHVIVHRGLTDESCRCRRREVNSSRGAKLAKLAKGWYFLHALNQT